MILLWIIGYIFIASVVTAVVGMITEGKESTFAAAFIGAFWLPMGVGAVGFLLLVTIPYKLTQLALDKLKKV